MHHMKFLYHYFSEDVLILSCPLKSSSEIKENVDVQVHRHSRFWNLVLFNMITSMLMNFCY